MRKLLVCTLWLVGLVSLAGCRHAAPPEPAAASAQIHGVKTYLNQDNLQARYPSYDTLVTEMRQGGVDAVFTTLYEGRKAFYASQIIPERDPAIDLGRLRESAKKQNVKFGAICQIFYDADTLAQRPDLVPIDQHGSGEFVNWQRLVCPSDPGLPAIQAVDRQGNRLHHPARRREPRLHAVPDDVGDHSGGREAGVDPQLLLLRSMRAQLPAGVIRRRATSARHDSQAGRVDSRESQRRVGDVEDGLITSFVEEAAREVRAIDPAIEVSVHVVPWAESVFDNALVWNAAQDVTALSRHVDYLSPMIYHKLIGRPTDYIRTLTAELATKTKRKILPSIQTAEIVKEGQLSADEFKQSLDNALASPSAGTLIFHWGELRPDDQAPALRREKSEIFKAAAERR